MELQRQSEERGSSSPRRPCKWLFKPLNSMKHTDLILSYTVVRVRSTKMKESHTYVICLTDHDRFMKSYQRKNMKMRSGKASTSLTYHINMYIIHIL